MKEEKIKKGLLEFRLEKKKERGALKLHLLYGERGDSVCIGSWIFVWNTVPSTSIRLAKSVSCIVSFFFFIILLSIRCLRSKFTCLLFTASLSINTLIFPSLKIANLINKIIFLLNQFNSCLYT